MSNSTIDHLWESFGLEPDASSHKINAAFRRLSKRAHPDAGGSREHFENLQHTREILLGAARGGTVIDLRQQPADHVHSVDAEPRPAPSLPSERPRWLPGAALAVPVFFIVGAFGLIRLDRTLIAIGLVAALAVWLVTTVFLAVRAQHARNTEPEVIYPSAEEILQMRARRIRAERIRARRRADTRVAV